MEELELEGLVPVRLSKVTSNDTQELIYLPKLIVRKLGLEKGTRVLLCIDKKRNRLVIVPMKEI